MTIQPMTLTGDVVTLVPLHLDHVPALWVAGDFEALWRYMPWRISSLAAMEKLVQAMLQQQDQGVTQPFATTLTKSGAVIGSTSFLAIDSFNKRLEIGGTWITPAQQRSAVNTEAKLLQLSHAFEVLDCNRVEFKTDALNDKSRAAISRLGAQEEGVFRRHMVMPGGRLRDSAYFSIIKEEWPDVRRLLASKLT